MRIQDSKPMFLSLKGRKLPQRGQVEGYVTTLIWKANLCDTDAKVQMENFVFLLNIWSLELKPSLELKWDIWLLVHRSCILSYFNEFYIILLFYHFEKRKLISTDLKKKKLKLTFHLVLISTLGFFSYLSHISHNL